MSSPDARSCFVAADVSVKRGSVERVVKCKSKWFCWGGAVESGGGEEEKERIGGGGGAHYDKDDTSTFCYEGGMFVQR